MGHQRGRVGRVWASAALSALALSACWVLPARADRISLRGGGTLRGKVLPDPKFADRVLVLLERGKTPLSLGKRQLLGVVPEAGPLDDYLKKRDAAAATAQGQFDLGAWCGTHKLADLAEVHYEAALKLDAAFAPAHKKLGHVLYADKWLTPDELRAAQGMVRYKGRWITREEKDRYDQDGADAAEQASWVQHVQSLRDAIAYGSEDRKREAESKLYEIRDPAAVGPLVKVLGPDTDPMRVTLARVLGGIPGREAARALADRLLAESDSAVRSATMDVLERRKDPEAVKRLVRALKSTEPAVVNRSAWALANLKAEDAVPSLVGALFTQKQEVVMAPDGGGGGGGEAGAINATFGSGPAYAPATSTPLYGAPIAFNGSSVGYLTPPAVGPGVVAFGATSLPYYQVGPAPPVGPAPVIGLGQVAPGAGVGVAGGGGLNASRGPVPHLLTRTFRNVEVHAALVKLTGEDFGFDSAAWNRWVRTSFQADRAPARRVRQP